MSFKFGLRCANTMIHRQDHGVLLSYYLGYSRIRNIAFRLKRKPVTRFLTFHDIPDEAYSYFKANMHFLKRGTNVVSFGDFFSGNLSSNKINVVITFDDGYKSWVTHALPVLEELGLPATFFVTSGFVGLSKEDEAEFLRSKLCLTIGPKRMTRGLNYEDIRRIIKCGFAVGGHTLNHYNLGKLQDISQVRCEIAEDKMRLENETGVKIEYFAYPSGGYYNPKINLVDVLKESGYKAAVTTVPGFNKDTSSPFLLHRELIGALMPGRVFRARVYGNYDAVGLIKERIIKTLHLQ